MYSTIYLIIYFEYELRDLCVFRFRVVVSLFFLKGLSWIMEIISFAIGGSAFIWMASDVWNILSGIFIFVILVCKPNVWKMLKAKFPCLKRLSCRPFNTHRVKTDNVSGKMGRSSVVIDSNEMNTISNESQLTHSTKLSSSLQNTNEEAT